ncbi:MAG TPA: GFA family protein [Steroidobacteraceae bacterium]|jgi:hypothetical protein|nr:GFA family protein [Steroidobacteraceae bacterium]
MGLNTLGTLNQGRETTATSQAGPSATPTASTEQRFSVPSPIAGANPADVYHGSGIPASPNLLTQRGVGAYLQLLNAFAGDQLHERSADLLTTSLRSASATLRLAYHEAASRLPPALVSKDWGFSVSGGSLIFTPHQDQLSAQDLTDLSHAFTRSNVESAAKEVATVITSIVQMRKAGADPGSLAWVRFDVDVEAVKFGDSLDLRIYVTATAPGSLYHPNAAPLSHWQIPPLLGGMDFRELVTARPRFLRADGSVSPEALDEFDIPHEAPQICTLHGQCACSQVRLVVQDDFEYAFYCHCSRCRARTGSAFAAIAGISIDKVEVTAGHEHLLLEGECSDGYGARCRRCFSFLFAAVRERKYLHVSLGVLVDMPGRVPDHHIYVASKAPWYQITDALPQYDESP